MQKKRPGSRRLSVETLESRCVLSLIFGFDQGVGAVADALASADANGGGKAGGSTAPAIRLDLVSLHEFGHSLGLQHSSDPNSIMYPYYNANYNLANFARDSAVATFQSIYTGPNTGPWKDSLDPIPGDGKVEITYSFMPDGTRLDSGKTSTAFKTFDKIFGAGSWQPIFADQLNRWASVSNASDPSKPTLSFAVHTDSGLPFNYSGAAENDSRSGDIRIGAHQFDGAGKTLAHTYFPPPNGSTAAGDSHYDNAENWVLAPASSLTLGNSGGSSAASSFPGSSGLLCAAMADGANAEGLAVLLVSTGAQQGQDSASTGATEDVSETVQKIEEASPVSLEGVALDVSTSSSTDLVDRGRQFSDSKQSDAARDRLFETSGELGVLDASLSLELGPIAAPANYMPRLA